MPLDRNGTELNAGDPVQITGRIRSLEDTSDGRNAEVEIDVPPGAHRPTIHVTSACLKLDE